MTGISAVWKIFDDCLCLEQMKGIPWAKSEHGKPVAYITEGSMFYFKKRNARVIGKNMEKMDEACERNNADINNNFYFGIGTNYSNADTDILNAILS